MVRITKAGHDWLVCGDITPDEGVVLSLYWGWGPMHIYNRGPRDGAHDVTYGGDAGRPCSQPALWDLSHNQGARGHAGWQDGRTYYEPPRTPSPGHLLLAGPRAQAP